MVDRRHSPRKPLEADVDYESGDVRATARLANIGPAGIYILTLEPLPTGARLKLSFVLPDGRPIQADGRVAHSQGGIGMGVFFVNIKPDDVTHIRELLEPS